ncbi:MAG: hypothetical protein GX779_05385 [Clostridia bacterium]|nr:hypothetical protein [Clostridia bacterium]
MKRRLTALLAALFIVSLLVSAFAAGPVQAAPAAYDPLGYYLYYTEDVNQFYFLVTNPSSQAVNLKFSSGQDYDLVIKQKGKVVWKDSWNKNYSQAVRQENFLPGHAKFYKIDAPKLRKGSYQVQAIFTAGPSAGRVVAEIQWGVGQIVPEKPSADTSLLDYYLFKSTNTNELLFVVKNNTDQTVKLHFPSGKEFDLIIYNASWQKAWQDSWTKWYHQSAKKEKLAPGQAKVYRAKLPKLSPGTYTVHAYFYGAKLTGPAATMKLKAGGQIVNPHLSQLSFSAWYNGGKQPQIAFQVKNTGTKPVTITFPQGKTLEVVVTGDNGFSWRYSDSYRSGSALLTRSLAGGGASYSFIYLPKLPKGKYTVDIYYLAYSEKKPAASTSFRI